MVFIDTRGSIASPCFLTNSESFAIIFFLTIIKCKIGEVQNRATSSDSVNDGSNQLHVLIVLPMAAIFLAHSVVHFLNLLKVHFPTLLINEKQSSLRISSIA